MVSIEKNYKKGDKFDYQKFVYFVLKDLKNAGYEISWEFEKINGCGVASIVGFEILEIDYKNKTAVILNLAKCNDNN